MELAMSENTEVATTEQPTENQKNVIRYNPIFPALMLEVDLELPIADMTKDMVKLANGRTNYHGGFTTYFDSPNVIETVRGVAELKQAIYGVATNFGRELKFEANYDKCSIHLWGSVYNKGGYHPPHNHPRSVFSGTFYASIADDMSPLIIMNPTAPFRGHEPAFRPQDATAFTAESMVVKPKANQMLMWPSWLYHHVPEMTVKGPRVAFSFNVDFLPPGV